MPTVPYSPVPGVVPSTSVPNDYLNVQAAPSDFGAQVGQAEQGLGGAIEKAGEETGAAAFQYQTRVNNVASDAAFNQHQTNVNNILYGDPNHPETPGYFGLHGADAMAARAGVQQALEDSRKNISAGLNAAQALTFDEASRRLNMNSMNGVGSHYEQEFNRYAVETQTAGIDIKARAVANGYNDDNLFLHNLEDAGRAADAKSALSGADPNTPAGKDIFANNRALASQTLHMARAVAMGTANPSAGLAFVQANVTQFDALTYHRLTDEFKSGADAATVATGIGNAMTPGGGGNANTGPIANKTLPPEAQKFLPALSGGEGNYASPAPTGDQSDAPVRNNRYQFLRTTWNGAAPAAGVDANDTSPAAQDAVAWQHAQDVYKTNTGGNLQADIAAGGNEAKIAGALNKVWPSLPGGKEQNTTMAQFISRMGGGTPGASASPPIPQSGARDQAISPRYMDEINMISRAYAQTQPMMQTNPKVAMQIRNGVMEQIQRENAFENGAQDRASRDLSNHQRDNEATLFGAAVGNQSIAESDLANYLKTQQITPAGYTAIKSVQQRQAEGQDEPKTVAALWDGIGNGSVTSQDVFTGIVNGVVRGTTGNEMIKALGARAKVQTNAVERGDYETLKTALGGHALESGSMDIFGEAKQAHAQLWTQAQGEWNRRVVSGTEKPDDVLGDMMPRYQKSIPDKPAAWPNPRFGMVQSTQDVAAVAAKTKAALDAGTINSDTYQSEGSLLARYLTYYQMQDAQKAAAAKLPKGSRPAALTPGNE